MRAVLRLILAMVVVMGLGCSPTPGKSFSFEPNARLAPAQVTVDPPPGPFAGEVTVTFTVNRPEATIYVSTSGRDPRTSSVDRVSGHQVSVTLEATQTLRYFTSVVGEPDSELQEGEWVRASGTPGTISGVLVVGAFAVGKRIGLARGSSIQNMAPVASPSEVPFRITGLASGSYRLRGMMDRNDDQQLTPFIDYEGEPVSVALDLRDPAKAGPEGVRVYLGASSTGLGAITGTITLPKPPLLQQLRISALNAGALSGALDPGALLQQLQGGYQVLTTPTGTEYRYYIGELEPGQYTPVPALVGFGAGGVAFNLIANPLRPVTVTADNTATANFAFGPVTVTGTVRVGADAGVAGPLPVGVVAGRVASLTTGVQAVLMPVLFLPDATTGEQRASYGGESFLGNTSITLRAFTGAQGIVEALVWAINPLSTQPGHAVVPVTDHDVRQDLAVP